MRLVATCAVDTDETPSAVGRMPSMAQGCLPYSATIQPSSAASHGSGRLYSATRRYQRWRCRLRVDASQNEYANSAMNQKPQATINRNDQNKTGTLGMVLAAARAMSACVALVGSSMVRLSRSA